MARLLEDAEKLSGKEFDLSSYADITEAIHIVQEEMGIAGATALEASTTIEGSLNSTKSAWDNLLVGMSNGDADLDGLINNLVESASNLFNNLSPILLQAFTGASNLIEAVFPTVVGLLPQIITDFLPSLVTSALSMVQALVDGLLNNSQMMADGAVNLVLTLIQGIIPMLPQILTAGVDIVMQLALGLIQALPDLVAQVPILIDGLVNEFTNNGEKYWNIGKDIIMQLWEGLKASWTNLSSWFTNKWNSLFNKKASVSMTTSDADGSHAGGLSYVPYDGYTARLHKGERILTAEENKMGAGVTVVQNIYAEKQTASSLMQSALYQQRKAVMLGV